MVVLERAEFRSEAIPVTAGTRYRILLKVECASDRADTALVIFNTDQPISANQALNWFPQYTKAVGKPFAFISNPDPDGLVSIEFAAPPAISQIVLGLRRWAMEGTVWVASTLVVEVAPAGSQCTLVDNPNALRGVDYVTLSRAEVSFGDIAVDAGARYVVSAMVEDDTGRSDAALLTFTPDCPISPAEATEAFPRFTPAVGKPFTFLASANGAGIVTTSFIAPAGSHRIAIAARRWTGGGTVRLASRVLAVKASVAPGQERSISLRPPSRAVEIIVTPFASPFICESGRLDLTVTFLADDGAVVPDADNREGYRFSRIVVQSAAMADGETAYCAPEFICAPPQAREIRVQISGSDAQLLPAVEIGLRDIAPTLGDEPAILARRLQSRASGVRDMLFGPPPLQAEALRALSAEAIAAVRSLTAVRSALMAERPAGAPAEGDPVASPAMAQTGAAIAARLREAALTRLNRNDTAGTFGRMLLWSPDVPMPKVDPKPRSRLRIACILGERLFEGLVHEAELLLLTQSTWKQTLRFGRVDVVLIESTWATCTGDWYMAQFERSECRDQLGELVALARSLRIPTVFWMTLDREYLPLYEDFASRFDHVFCADTRSLTGLARCGVQALPLLPAIQPRRFNPIRSYDDRSQCRPGIVYDGWTDLYKFSETRAVLGRLPVDSLAIIDTAFMIGQLQVQRLPDPALQKALKGSVHRQLLPEIYKRADAYISFSRSSVTPTQASWALVEAAACRVPLIHLGPLEPDDFRCGFVRQWLSPDEFTSDIDEVMSNRLARDVAAHPAWREAHAHHSFADRLAAICKAVGIRHNWQPFPKATVVTGTMRPHLLEKCVRQYLDQTYPNKELVVVFNGAASELAEIRAKYDSQSDIIFRALPTERHTGSLINFGAQQGTGDYFFKVDDDDHYGPNYIYDCMLHLRAKDVDIFGKQATFYHFEEDNSLYLLRNILSDVIEFPARELESDKRAVISGCSFACKSEILKEIYYPDDINFSADTEFLNRIQTTHPDAQCLMVDSLNLVVERSVDVASHTWRQPASQIKRVSRALDMVVSDLMV